MFIKKMSMKKINLLFCLVLLISLGCKENSVSNSDTNTANPIGPGQSAVVDSDSKPNIVQIAVGSADHSTLVTALKAAGLVDALSNAGPFTVFAPTNAAFEKLPAGTVESLLKPENKDKLSDILGYHTYVGVLDGVLLQDGLQYDMVFGGKVQIGSSNGKPTVNGHELKGTIKTSNGVIHVIDEVLLPK
jgi:uncharacterized surface protein with fasciclin (FAS1) repeats